MEQPQKKIMLTMKVLDTCTFVAYVSYPLGLLPIEPNEFIHIVDSKGVAYRAVANHCPEDAPAMTITAFIDIVEKIKAIGTEQVN